MNVSLDADTQDILWKERDFQLSVEHKMDMHSAELRYRSNASSSWGFLLCPNGQ